MFTPLKIQQQRSRSIQAPSTPQPITSTKSSTSGSLQQLRTPVDMGSLSVLRLRQLVKEQGKGWKDDAQIASPTRFEVASDLSALMGGAPVSKVFLHMMTTTSSNDNDEEKTEVQSEDEQHISLSFATNLSPIRSTVKRKKLSHQMLMAAATAPSSRFSVFDDKNAKYLDDELTLKMPRQQLQIRSQTMLSGDRPRDEISASSSPPPLPPFLPSPLPIPLEVVMHCREIGMKIANSLRLKPETSNLLKRVVELLVNFGEDQHNRVLESSAKVASLENELREFRSVHGEVEAARKSEENERLRRKRENSYEGLSATYKAMSKTWDDEVKERNQKSRKKKSQQLQTNSDHDEKGNEQAGDAADDDDEDVDDDDDDDDDDRNLSDVAKDRKRMIKQLVHLQGLLAAEKEAVEQLNVAKRDLTKRLDDQAATHARREQEQRELLLRNSELHEQLEQKLRSKSGEVATLRQEVKELQGELDDKIWLGTVEVESTEVAMSMLRKHSKDVESRCAITLMRLRQEQELVTKLKRKLADLGSSLHDLERRCQGRQLLASQNVQPQQLHQTTALQRSTASSSSHPGLSNPPSPATKHVSEPLLLSSSTSLDHQSSSNVNNNATVSTSATQEQQLQNQVSSATAVASPATTLDPTAVAAAEQQQQHHQLQQDEVEIQRHAKDVDEMIRSVDAVGAGVAISSAQTPRPDKEAIARSVPTLGSAQLLAAGSPTAPQSASRDSVKAVASASTASIVEALVSIIKTQDERIKLESRSWEEAQEQADKLLAERKEKMKCLVVDVEVQTE